MKMYKIAKYSSTILLTLLAIVLGCSISFAKDYSFSWSANAEPVEGYRLYYKMGGVAGPPFDGTGATEGSSPIDLGKVTSFTISGLLDNTTYHFALTAYNGTDESDYTDVITVFPTVGTVDPLSAKISVDKQSGEAPLTISFDASSSTGVITGYSWVFGDGNTGTGGSVSHTYQNPGSYTAVLTIADGTGQTSQSSVVIVVSDVTLAGASYSFSWTANAEPVAGYKLYYKKGGVAGPPFDGTGAAEGSSPIDLGKVTSCTVSGLLDNTTYHFALTAYNGTDESDYTDVITVFPTGGTVDQLSAIISVDKQSGDAPLAVNFDASSSTGSITGYSWVFGDGGTGTGSSVSHTYQNSGSYTAVLTIADGAGQTEQASVSITVLDPLSAKISVDKQSGEAPLAVNFNASSSTGSITGYSWVFGDGATGTGSSVSHTYQNSGSYTAVLTITDGAGQTEQASVSITVSDPLSAKISVDKQSGDAPLVVNFDASSSNGSITGYSWVFGDGGTGTGSSVSHTYQNSGSYTAVLTVEDGNGVSKEASTTITVTEVIFPEPPIAAITASATTGTAPLSVTVNGADSTGDISSYVWNFGDNSVAGSGQSLTHVYSEPGTYTITLTVSDSAGQISQKSVVIVVSDVEPAGASYSFSWTANPEPVEGYKLYYKKGGEAAPPFDGTGAAEGSSPIDLGKVTSFTISGLLDNTTYHFALTAYNGSDESDFTNVITVFPSGGTVEPLSANINVNNSEGEVPLTVNFDGSGSTGSISSYSWNFGDGDIATGPAVSHSYSSVGNYTATLTVVDDNGSSLQEHIVITVSETTSGDQIPPTAIAEVDSGEGTVPFVAVFNGGSSTCAPGNTIASYEWDFGDGSENQYGVTVEHSFSQAGVYLVVLKVTDNNGNLAETTIFITASAAAVEENTDPIAVFTQTSTVGAVPFSVEFDASGSNDPDGDNLIYSWTFGDGATASGVVVEHTYENTGVFSVKLIVEDGRGAATEVSQTIAVLTAAEYERFLRGKKVKSIINIINSLLLNDE
ncbi:PKD domain-containing protein [Desulforhopalus sp. IMCC35007]|uniref:PKD domain-containing protein n=1 Tax=Desulforhopalus sp. IMCC35007 TaxID=2569543 RepID=UPI0010ADCC0A|nr:PKD domain-containing protein [Desulforhopalus sp. IMCC35007]TKB07436.1 PKD domain-containing protein [Desulforhopalus sp. IMCC35007]